MCVCVCVCTYIYLVVAKIIRTHQNTSVLIILATIVYICYKKSFL